MARQEGGHKEAAPIIGQDTQPCCYSGGTRSDLHATHDRDNVRTKAPAPPCAPEQRVPVRHPVVGSLPALVEWQVHSSTPATIPRFVVRCLRVLGLQGSQSYLPVVPGKVATVVAAVPHCSQRNGPTCCGSGSMGTRLAHSYRAGFLRQHGCGLRRLSRVSKRPTADAPAPVLALLLCVILPSDPSEPHSWYT